LAGKINPMTINGFKSKTKSYISQEVVKEIIHFITKYVETNIERWGFQQDI